MNHNEILKVIEEEILMHDGKHHRYITICETVHLLKVILETGQYPQRLTINPFYRTSTGQREYDEYMLFALCVDYDGNIDPSVKREMEMNTDENVCFFYRKNKEDFRNAVKRYIENMNTLVDKITQSLLEEYQIKPNELLQGAIIFEVYAD